MLENESLPLLTKISLVVIRYLPSDQNIRDDIEIYLESIYCTICVFSYCFLKSSLVPTKISQKKSQTGEIWEVASGGVAKCPQKTDSV